jgi:AraC family transcriptional regulator
MSVTNKALFVVERNLRSNSGLDEIAASCGVSRFHLSRAFGEATGMSVVEYARARRLSEAAKEIAAGARNLLSVALDHGYGGHEAFSRAFKARFGATPEAVRKSATVEGLALVEPFPRLKEKATKLEKPRIAREGELLFVGSTGPVPFGDTHRIPGMWERFMSGPYRDIAHKRAEPPVGIVVRMDAEGVEHMCAAGVSRFENTPKGCVELTLSPATYAVFPHDAHVARVRETYEAIWNDWLPERGETPSGAPSFERHNAAFDPRTGNGGVTIWIPICR